MDFLSASIIIDESKSRTLGNFPVYEADASVLQGTIAWQKANSVFCPLGPAPTRVWVLMLKRDLDRMLAEETKEDGAGGRNGTHFINWRSNYNGTETIRTFRLLYYVQSQRLFLGGTNDKKALHLVEFCDARGICAQMSDSENTQVNVRSYADETNYLDGTEGGTWESLIETLWDKCPGLGEFPGLPAGFTPDGVPENARFVGVSAYQALNAVLDKLDCALCHVPMAGLYEINQLGTEQLIVEPEGNMLKWSAEPQSSIVSKIPEKVRVYFRNNYLSFGQERDTELENNWSTTRGDEGFGDYEDVATNESGALTGTIKSLWDDLPRLLDEDGIITNSAELTGRATFRKNGWLLRQKVGHVHKIYIGLQNLNPGQRIRATIWRNWGDGRINPLGGTVTEYVARPELVWGFEGQTGAASQVWVNFIGDIAQDNYKPLDLARHSFPNYPRLCNIVQVLHDDENPGLIVEANADGFHPGKIRRFVAGELVTLDDCWIRFVDKEDGDVNAIDGECYGPARLSGVATSSSSLLPVYVVRKGADSSHAFVAKNGGSPIAGRTGTTAGSGTVTLYDLASDGTLTSLGLNRVAYNIAADPVAGDAWLQVKRVYPSNRLVVDWEEREC